MRRRTTTVRLSEAEKNFLKSLVGDKVDLRFTTGVSVALKRLITYEMARQAAREVIEVGERTEAHE